ncbi:MAG: T9SS type A sorting domain-containing protein [Ferruginibacter sp.]
MKRHLLLPLFFIFCVLKMSAQVTQINSNKSLEFEFPIGNNKAIFVSRTDQTLWVTDGTTTSQLSPDILFVDDLGGWSLQTGKFIFAGSTPATGTEIYVTDGTTGGTMLVKDIYPGVLGSLSNTGTDAAELNGFLYFTAERPAEGRELWRTDGTLNGTTLVKDIVTGPASSNDPGSYELFSNGTYLLFAAITPSSGIELWKSDGTSLGTNVLKDINTGHSGADSSNPRSFYTFNNIVLFAATDDLHGEEIWRTDGTPGGTTITKDLNNGSGSSTKIQSFPGFFSPVFISFHTFQNKAYFNVYDGTSTGVIAGTDGTPGNTSIVKDIVPGTSSSVALLDAVDLSNKFIFPVFSIAAGRTELWESNGTPGGTKLFETFKPGGFTYIYVPRAYDIASNTLTQPLFQGNKFFFAAGTASEGFELWISDGVDSLVSHTHIVKDINAGTPDGIDKAHASYIYTGGDFYFPANNGMNGLELWKSDGTSSGTAMVADIVTGAGDSDPNVAFLLVNGKILFEADNGDDPSETDLYAVNGTFIPLPLSLEDFTVIEKSGDAILQWHTLQEMNSKDFTLQRSFDGIHFEDIIITPAQGNSSVRHGYAFTDAGIINSGRNSVYYRLRVGDIDGKYTFGPVILLRLKQGDAWSVKLLSNPVTDRAKVLLTGVKGTIQLSIHDLNGRKLYSSSFVAVNGQLSIPANNLPHGTYMLVAVSGQESQTLQFVK